jgi:hypothetical protein
VPIKVKEFKSKIRDEDGILIATPEYNYSVPRVLEMLLIACLLEKRSQYMPYLQHWVCIGIIYSSNIDHFNWIGYDNAARKSNRDDE